MSTLTISFKGGLEGIGATNMTGINYNDFGILIDAGAKHSNEPSRVAKIIPNCQGLEDNEILVVTHGHYDHIAAAPIILRRSRKERAVVATPFTASLLESMGVNPGQIISMNFDQHIPRGEKGWGDFETIYFIPGNHTVPDSAALYCETPEHAILHLADLRRGTAYDGVTTDEEIFRNLARNAVKTQKPFILFLDATGAQEPGFTPNDQTLFQDFDRFFSHYRDNRVLLALFASNAGRLQMLIDLAIRHGRKIAISGTSLKRILNLARTKINPATKKPYIDAENVLIDPEEAEYLPDEKVIFVLTGTQFEIGSSLYKLALQKHDDITAKPGDVLVISARVIPKNEPRVERFSQLLEEQGITVISNNGNSDASKFNASGHMYQEDSKIILNNIIGTGVNLYLIPVQADRGKREALANLARECGISEDHILLPENDQVVKFEKDSKGGWSPRIYNARGRKGPILLDKWGNIIKDEAKEALYRVGRGGAISIAIALEKSKLELIDEPHIEIVGFALDPYDYAKLRTKLINCLSDYQSRVLQARRLKANVKKEKDLARKSIELTIANFTQQIRRQRPHVVCQILEI